MERSARDDTEPPDFDDLNVAVAHWHVNAWGGAEYLVTKLADAVGVDTVYTLGPPDPDDPNPYGDVAFVDVTPTLDYAPVRRLQRRAGRVFEYAQWEDVDWRAFGNPDVLVTSGATTRAVITPVDTLHVNYCHSPPRWFYDLYHDRKSSLAGIATRPLVRYLRMRDATLNSRVDHYFANSPIIERRLWKYYKRGSEVLYPPLDLEKYHEDGDGGYFLHLGRLDEEKGVPAVVEAFEGLDERLVMAGGRGDVDDDVVERVRRADNIDYRGFVSEEEKLDLLANCTAVVFNGKNEDFGIVPIEANASGKPVLARDEGFPGVFVEDGTNGYRHDGTAEDIRDTVERVQQDTYSIGGAVVAEFALSTFEAEIQRSLVDWYTDVVTGKTHD
ncbi:glycosyltransferase [Halarchaeum nitratireducens]|uniref:Mannosyltransferase n=1 Tax=Halarchaeum nitratireducens TaxID=489913 RepID=A0A830GEM6_9EURY|nr:MULTISPECIES: glycosyltransferase [Halarchaeum]MBP2252618.1 glycosyltransferase involved in cell wall biosynthesis [Halarchaeum solikamskense]GGN23763.1 mannosyltransferase [Halarchaeum nitratireducens]